MSAIIVGSPSATATAANAKVLRRQNYQRDVNGLETISETYIIQTANRASLIPAKDVLHSAFSTASVKYSRMAVESISFSEQDGDLTEMSVAFVGLTSSTGLPPAVVRIVPNSGAGVYGPPIVIEVEFVTSLSENELLKGNFVPGTTSGNAYWTDRRIPIPSSINGVELPRNPRPPFINGPGQEEAQGTTFTGGTAQYDGYVLSDLYLEKRGLFILARAQFKEFFAVSRVL